LGRVIRHMNVGAIALKPMGVVRTIISNEDIKGR
jgi:hypothetical protein